MLRCLVRVGEAGVGTQRRRRTRLAAMTHSAAAGTGRAAAATRGDAHTPPTLYPPHCSSLCSSPFLIAFLPPSFTVPLLISVRLSMFSFFSSCRGPSSSLQHERRPRTGDHSDEDEHEESKQVTAAPYSQEEESALLEEAVQSNSVKFYNHCISEAAKRKNLRFALRLYEALRRKVGSLLLCAPALPFP